MHEDYILALGSDSKGKEGEVRGGVGVGVGGEPDREKVQICRDILTSDVKGEEGKSSGSKGKSKRNSKQHQFLFLLKSDTPALADDPSPAPSPPTRSGYWGVMIVTAGGGEVTVRCPTLKTARSLCTLLQQNNKRVKNPELSAL